MQVYGLSGPVARYIGRNGPILHRFANEDVTLGAWLVGLEVTHVDERRLCCDSAERCMAQVISACRPVVPCLLSQRDLTQQETCVMRAHGCGCACRPATLSSLPPPSAAIRAAVLVHGAQTASAKLPS